MPIILVIFALIVGSFFGTWLASLAFRRAEGRRLLNRNTCSVCLEPVHPLDSVPLISYLRLRGSCRHCSSVIMWQYPAIELISAIVFALIAIRLLNYSEYSYWLALRDLILSASAIIIFIYDVKIRRIPDFVTLLAIILIIPTNLMAGSSPEMLLMGILAGSLFFGIQFLATQGKLVGGAEIRLGALVGASFGMIPAIITIGLAYLIAGIVGAYLVITKKADIYDSVPFGSFLAIAIIFMVIFENEMVNLYLKILGL